MDALVPTTNEVTEPFREGQWAYFQLTKMPVDGELLKLEVVPESDQLSDPGLIVFKVRRGQTQWYYAQGGKDPSRLFGVRVVDDRVYTTATRGETVILSLSLSERPTNDPVDVVEVVEPIHNDTVLAGTHSAPPVFIVSTYDDVPSPVTLLAGTQYIVINDPNPALIGRHIAAGADLGQPAKFFSHQ